MKLLFGWPMRHIRMRLAAQDDAYKWPSSAPDHVAECGSRCDFQNIRLSVTSLYTIQCILYTV